MKIRSALALSLPLSLLLASGSASQTPLREAHLGDDFTLREEMVPMRDGAR